MKPKSEPLGVTRMNLDGVRTGWNARIMRNGERRSELFADDDCGGSRGAKLQALRRYRSWSRELGPAKTSHKGEITKRNKLGYVNVYHRLYVPRDKPHLEYDFWCGTWLQMNGKKKNKSFSWNRYTPDDAFQLAILASELEIADNDALRAEFQKRFGRRPVDNSEL